LEGKARRWKIGTTAREADEMSLMLRSGGWVEEAKSDDGAEIVLGGFMTEAMCVKPEATTGLKIMLSKPLVTTWTRYLEKMPEDHRVRLQIVKRLMEMKKWAGDENKDGSWAGDQTFWFVEGKPLKFTWRAWGDIQVAVTGHGHYMDWYY
jgi:hypothetical protein